jgi:predicted  nucleic acid-binding Zn-ribbon protein
MDYEVKTEVVNLADAEQMKRLGPSFPFQPVQYELRSIPREERKMGLNEVPGISLWLREQEAKAKSYENDAATGRQEVRELRAKLKQVEQGMSKLTACAHSDSRDAQIQKAERTKADIERQIDQTNKTVDRRTALGAATRKITAEWHVANPEWPTLLRESKELEEALGR